MRPAAWAEWGGLCRRQVGGAGLDGGGPASFPGGGREGGRVRCGLPAAKHWVTGRNRAVGAPRVVQGGRGADGSAIAQRQPF